VRIPIHGALFASFLAIVGLVVAFAVFLAGSGLRDEMRERFRTEIDHELGLLGELVRLKHDAPPDSLADALARYSGYRVTFIDTTGVVTGDSEVPTDSLIFVEDHSTRPEVLDAVGGDLGTSERISATVGEAFLYGARYIDTPRGRLVVRLAAPLDRIQSAVVRARRVVWGAGLLGAVTALIVAYFLTGLLSRPLIEISERASILARGDFSQRAPKMPGVTEMRQLSEAFNVLSDELQSRLNELAHERDEMQALIDTMAEGVVALTEDARVLRVNRAAVELLNVEDPLPYAPVDSLVRDPKLLEILNASVTRGLEAREFEIVGRHLIVSARPLESGGSVVTFLDVTEIRRLERVRRDFVANASHELKTPLTAIRGFAETLADAEPPEPLRGRFLESIRQNTVRLQRLVDDLLDLSKLESGSWQARAEAVSVAPVAEEVWEAALTEVAGGPVALEREVSFQVRGEAVAWCDSHSLDQILRNLYTNALRHLGDGEGVTTRIRRVDEMVEIEVIDDGEGISSEDLPRIFERFYRSEPARSRDAGGTGLGLSLVRHLVRAMGGEVSAESTVGQGTTVRFTLPLAEDDRKRVI